MIIAIQNTIGAIGRGLGIVTRNLQMWLGFTKANVLGKELVVNGDFATDSNWTKGAGWSIANGTAIQSSGTGQLYQEGALTAAKSYSVTVTIDSIASGTSLKVVLGSGGSELVFSNDGTTTFIGSTVAAGVGDTKLYLLGSGSGFSATISNISVKEVAQFIPDKSTNTNNAKLFTGKALSFNGNDKVVIGDVGVVKTLVFTFSPLANITSSTSGKRLIGFNTTFLGISTGAITGDLTGETLTILTGTNGRTAITNSFDGGSFYRVILSWNPSLSQFDVYINGQKQTTINSGTSVLANFTNLILGTTVTEQSYYSGILSDVQVYNTSWTSDDAVYDYANPNNLVFNNSASSIALSNLKGYYALSEGSGSITYDSSGQGNNGAITGATYVLKQPTIPQLGMVDWAKSTPVSTVVTLIEAPNDLGKDILGNSLTLRDGGFNLDGSGYAEVDSSSSLNIANYSIDGWIYATNNTSSFQSILTKHTQDNYQLFVRNSQIKLFNSTNNETVLSSINLNVWNYFCITESEGVIKFYLNNGSAQSIGTISQKFATNGKLYIGSNQSGDYWKGLIDDVRLYNGILSDKEVLNNYKIGLSKHS